MNGLMLCRSGWWLTCCWGEELLMLRWYRVWETARALWPRKAAAVFIRGPLVQFRVEGRWGLMQRPGQQQQQDLNSMYAVCVCTYIPELGALLFEIAQSLFALERTLILGAMALSKNKSKERRANWQNANSEQFAHEQYKDKRAQ